MTNWDLTLSSEEIDVVSRLLDNYENELLNSTYKYELASYIAFVIGLKNKLTERRLES